MEQFLHYPLHTVCRWYEQSKSNRAEIANHYAKHASSKRYFDNDGIPCIIVWKMTQLARFRFANGDIAMIDLRDGSIDCFYSSKSYTRTYEQDLEEWMIVTVDNALRGFEFECKSYKGDK